MKINKNFKLVYFDGKPYLIPFGQAAAKLIRPVKLNCTSVFIWNMLINGYSKDEILTRMIDEYKPEKDEIKIIKEDLNYFLEKLQKLKIIIPEEELLFDFDNNYVRSLLIAGVKICYIGPDNLLSNEFERYFTEFPANEADITIDMKLGIPAPVLPQKILIRNSELSLSETENCYICLFPESSNLQEWRFNKEDGHVYFYCKRPVWDGAANEVFQAIRMIFLVLAQNAGLFAIHSASVLYNGKAWLFCGHSGAGKSTHVNLWAEKYNTPILNGDINLIKLTENGFFVYGIPWCGTSGISTKDMFPLGGIVFVKKHKIDKAYALSKEEREFNLLLRIISPAWTENMLDRNVEFVKSFPASTPMFQLLCTKEQSAAYAMKRAIDNYGR